LELSYEVEKCEDTLKAYEGKFWYHNKILIDLETKGKMEDVTTLGIVDKLKPE
jgi:hypothetical protein